MCYLRASVLFFSFRFFTFFSFLFFFFCFVSFLTILFSFFCVSFFFVSFCYFSPCFLFVFFLSVSFRFFSFFPFLSLQVPEPASLHIPINTKPMAFNPYIYASLRNTPQTPLCLSFSLDHVTSVFILRNTCILFLMVHGRENRVEV